MHGVRGSRGRLPLAGTKIVVVMFDILFLLVVGLSTLFAALRGGIREIITLLALAAAGGLAWITVPGLLSVTGIGGSLIPTVIVAVALLAVYFIAAHLAMHFGMKRFPLKNRAALTDRIAGGVFGFLRGLVLIGLVFLGLTYVLGEEQQPDAVQNAVSRPLVASVAGWLDGFAPKETTFENIEFDADDASVQGYRRIDRDGIEDIVTTVTTDDPIDGEEAVEQSEDPIADILNGEEE